MFGRVEMPALAQVDDYVTEKQEWIKAGRKLYKKFSVGDWARPATVAESASLLLAPLPPPPSSSAFSVCPLPPLPSNSPALAVLLIFCAPLSHVPVVAETIISLLLWNSAIKGGGRLCKD